jgi:hypothetical protein
VLNECPSRELRLQIGEKARTAANRATNIAKALSLSGGLDPLVAAHDKPIANVDGPGKEVAYAAYDAELNAASWEDSDVAGKALSGSKWDSSEPTRE